MTSIWLRLRRSAGDFRRDRRGVAAIEFAIIAPVMLVMFLGTVEFSAGIAVNRKVTLIARTLADLTSQAAVQAVTDPDLQNIFTASLVIVKPYAQTPVKAQISEIYIDSNQMAKVQWSKGAIIANGAIQATLVASSRNAGDIVTSVVPPALLVKQTYLILSEVSYLYTPANSGTIGYVMSKTGVNLSDVAYTRTRQFACVTYNNVPVITTPPTCPTPP
jgi:Flp pilus assembly protein TadG